MLRGEHGEVTVPPLLWVKALDMVMDRLTVAGVDFSTIVALSGAAQVINTLRVGYCFLKKLSTVEHIPSTNIFLTAMAQRFA